jgi:cephalosporin hydroxylase
MNDLLTVIQTFGINGFPHGTDKTTDHSYEQIYPDLLAPFRYAPCTLLEIGVQSGGSLVLWQHYLRDATIYGIDRHYAVTHENRERLRSNPGQLFIGDAYTVAMLEHLEREAETPFDIIIDDGPHTLHSQQFVVRTYRQLLAPGGILVIEDIQDITHLDILTATLPERERGFVQMYDLRHVKGRYDDIVWVYRMPA